MPLFVKFWGTRGSIPTPGPKTQRYGGNTSCVELRNDEAVFICDGGTGLRELGVDLERRAEGQPITAHMFFSHPHWDHIQGFPFFRPAYGPKNTLYLYGDDEKLYQLLSGQMQSAYFPVNFADLKAKVIPRPFKDRQVEIDGVKVSNFEQKHPGASLGFTFECEGRKVVYSTDNELDQLVADPELAKSNPTARRTLPQALVDAVAGADLLIADGQYDEREYLERVGWGHPRASTAVDLAIQAKVKQLAIFHHDPMQSDREVDDKIGFCAERARKAGVELNVFGAREGMELKIG